MLNRVLRTCAGFMFIACCLLYIVALIVQFPLWIVFGKLVITPIVDTWIDYFGEYMETGTIF